MCVWGHLVESPALEIQWQLNQDEQLLQLSVGRPLQVSEWLSIPLLFYWALLMQVNALKQIFKE